MASTELLQPGTVLEGRYEVLRLLGRGGMGAVYVVKDLRLETRQWALKEMWPSTEEGDDPQQARDLFEKEAKLLAGLQHTNLPRVTDFFVHAVADGLRHYLVMDFIEGRTLEATVEADGPVPPPQLVAWAVQICDVLQYLHTLPEPIILRDLKPGNVMLTPSGEVKVIDFGIARKYRPGQAGDTVALGTPGFAPPEQYGRAQSDARADVYGLGATLHFALTRVNPGDRPFHFEPPSRFNPAVPASLDAVILTAVQVDPARRYATALAAAEALQMAMGWATPDAFGPGRSTRSAFTIPVTTLSGLLSSRGSGKVPASLPPRPVMAPPTLPGPPPSHLAGPQPVPGRWPGPPAPPGGPPGPAVGAWGATPTARMAPLATPAPPAAPPLPQEGGTASPPGSGPTGAPWFDPATLHFGVIPPGMPVRRPFRIRGEVEGRLATSDRWLRVEPRSIRGRDPHGEIIVHASGLRPGRTHQGAVRLETPQGSCLLPVTVQVDRSRLGAWTTLLAILLTGCSLLPVVGLAGPLGLFLLYGFAPAQERGALGGWLVASVIIGLCNALMSTGMYWLLRSLFP